MMDEVTLEETQNYLDKTFPSSPPIMRLPMICKNDLSADKIISKGFFSNTIITASRAEFPYKGYLLGLLDDFVYLNTKLSDIKLVIVSDGDDINILKNRINNLPSNIQQKISLFGWMNQHFLLNLINKQTEVDTMESLLMDIGRDSYERININNLIYCYKIQTHFLFLT